MKTYELYWLDGSVETVTGTDIKNAFTKAGYSAGAIKALGYYEEVN